jgi:hypothetical protein
MHRRASDGERREQKKKATAHDSHHELPNGGLPGIGRPATDR